MIPNYYCRQILPKEKLNYVKKLITAEGVDWKDGTVSMFAGAYDKKLPDYGTTQKKLLETFNQDVFSIIMSEVDKDEKFLSMVTPRRTDTAMVSKIEKGGFYRCHLDNEFNGHYSTTIFLSEPEDYKGGELQLLIDGQVKNIKLKAGWGITYATGIPHQVLSVTEGVRYASIFWSKSLITDPFIREIYYSLTQIQNKYTNSGLIDKVHTDIKEFVDDPRVEIAMLKKTLLRRYL
mgnify:FL=1